MATTLEQIASLAQAGFTKSEIVALLTAQTQNQAQKQEQKQEQKQNPVTQPAANQEQKKEQEPVTPPVPQPVQKSETEKLIEALGLKLDSLATAVYGQNISSMGKPTITKTTDELTDDVIAHIINPDGTEV